MKRNKDKTINRPSSPPKGGSLVTSLQSLIIPRTLIPSAITILPISYRLSVMAQNQPWGAAIGPQQLARTLRRLPKGA